MNTKKTESTGAENIRWNLDQLFSGFDDSSIEATLNTATSDVKSFVEKYKTKVATLNSMELKMALDEMEALQGPLYRLSQYSHLVFSTDTADNQAKMLIAKVQEAGSKLSNELVFFHLEFGALPPDIFAKHAKAPELKDYIYKLGKAYKNAKYNLSEAEERVINLKDLTGSSAFQKLYNEYTSSYSFEFELDGEIKKMNGSELRSMRMNPDASVRKRAMETFFARHEKDGLILASIYNNIVKDKHIEDELRGFEEPISAMNIHNDLTKEAVEALHQVTTESYALVNRYYKLKKKILGLEKLTLADIYAPMPSSSKSYSFDEAKALVLEGFAQFDSEFYDLAKSMFDENRIDAPTTPTKQGGAYCSSSTPDLKPYVFLNFTGKARDVSTMAHELGHAIHAMLSSKQNLGNYHSILPLAETASIFSEMVLTDYFLKKETDKDVKIALLTSKLEDILATSHRQNMFSRFEIKAHDAIGKSLLSAEDLSALYKTELEKMFGDAIDYTPEYEWEWSSIPHIYNVPFYVYAYNFGNLLVFALYQQYLEMGVSFIPLYKEFLSSGSSNNPVELAQIVKADITNPKFWRKSIAYIKKLIDELEALV